MKISVISRNPLHTLFYITVGVIAWLSVARRMIFHEEPMVVVVVSLPLIPIIFLPLVFLLTKIVIYEDRMAYRRVLSKKTYSLNGIQKVYRKMVRQHELDEEFHRFPYVTFEYENVRKVYFPFAMLSSSNNTKLLLEQIEKVNAQCEFDEDLAIIKSGGNHPMNKVFRFISFGLASAIALIITIMGLST